jgi:hypothetical protein
VKVPEPKVRSPKFRQSAGQGLNDQESEPRPQWSAPRGRPARGAGVSCLHLAHGNLRRLLGALILFATLSLTWAQPYSMNWSKIAGGGGLSKGGEFSLRGTIGQHDAGEPMSGGEFTLAGGFWGTTATAFPLPPPPAASVVWTNTAGGNWSVAANWSPNQVPAPTNTVRIAAPGTYTVTGDVGDLKVVALTVGGAGSGVQTFQLNGAQLYGAFTVETGGVIASVSSEPTVNAGGSLTVLSGGTMNLGAGLNLLSPCTNNGTINLTNGYLAYQNNGFVNAEAGGLVNQRGGTINFWGSGGIQGSGARITSSTKARSPSSPAPTPSYTFKQIISTIKA